MRFALWLPITADVSTPLDSNPLNARLGWQIFVKVERSRYYGGVTFPGVTNLERDLDFRPFITGKDLVVGRSAERLLINSKLDMY